MHQIADAAAAVLPQSDARLGALQSCLADLREKDRDLIMEFPHEHERLMELIGLVRDGGLDDSQTSELESILENDPQALRYYVESIDVISMLHRQQGMVDVGQDVSQSSSVTQASVMPPNRGLWPVVCWSAAICASLAIGVLLGAKLFQVDDPSDSSRNAVIAQVDNSNSEIATLSFAAGCLWDSDDQPRHEGQRLRAETLRLEEGVAVVQFDSDVRLVLEGPSCYTPSPMCSPTRISILTGKNPARHGVTQWLPGVDRAFGRQGESARVYCPKSQAEGIKENEITLGEAFQQGGYDTAFYGKWHMGKLDATGGPANHGYASQRAVIQENSCAMFYPFRDHPEYFPNAKEGDNFTDLITDAAIEFVTQERSEPFYLHLSHFAMHAPIGSKPNLRDHFQKKADLLPAVANDWITDDP